MPVRSQQKSGFIAISSVLVITSVVIALAIGTSLSAIGEGQSGMAVTSGETALHLAEGCMEDALWGLRLSGSYTGGTTTLLEGSCTNVVSAVSNVYTLTSTATVAGHTRVVQVIVTRGTSLTLTSWKEM